MKKTKRKILDAALVLFNEQGVSDTTLRNIAQHIGISQGNLNYHYRLKEDIVEALYFELVEKMDERVAMVDVSQPFLSMVYESTSLVVSGMYEYRFLLRDFYKIMRESDTINNHYAEVQQRRRTEFLALVGAMQQIGQIRVEEFEGEYVRLQERLTIIGNNWINSFESIRAPEVTDIQYYADLIFECLYPYLTAAGKKEYRAALARK